MSYVPMRRASATTSALSSPQSGANTGRSAARWKRMHDFPISSLFPDSLKAALMRAVRVWSMYAPIK